MAYSPRFWAYLLPQTGCVHVFALNRAASQEPPYRLSQHCRPVTVHCGLLETENFLSPLRAFVTYRHAFCLLGRLHNIVFVRFSVIMVIHFEPAVFSSTARPFCSATRISLRGFVFVFHRQCRLHMLNTYRRATVFGRPTIMASITVCRSFRQHSRTTRNASRKKQT